MPCVNVPYDDAEEKLSSNEHKDHFLSAWEKNFVPLGRNLSLHFQIDFSVSVVQFFTLTK